MGVSIKTTVRQLDYLQDNFYKCNFRMNLECLAWKTLKDKMECDGLTFERLSPKYIFKDAYKGKYIDCEHI